MEFKKISAMGYGFVIISPVIFEQCRKNKNIKDRKMISYFSKDNDAFYDFISQGAFIPIHHINYDRYTLFFSIGKYDETLLKDWNIQIIWELFNLQIDDSNTVWAMEIEEVEKWSIKNLNKAGDCIEGIYYDINDNEHKENKALKYNLPASKYHVKIYGLSRKIKLKDGMENYGFLFELTKTEVFNSKTDPSEVDFSKLFV